QGPNDSLEVVINDYTTQAYLPVPTLIQYPSAIWTGARELVDWDQTVRLSLSFNPTKNPRSLFRFVSLSPYQLFGYKISSVLSLLTCALYAIPILWFLFLLNEHTYLPWIDRDYLKALKRISKFLLALTLLPGIERSAFVLAGLIFQRWRPALTGFAQVNSSNNPVLLFLGTLVVCFLSAIVLTIVKTLIRHHTVRVWLAELRTGVFLASLIQVLLDGFYLAVLFVTRDLSESLIPGTLMTLCFLALIAFCVRRLAKQWLPVRIPFQYVFLSLILLLLWAYPAHRNIYSLDRPEFSTWDVTYSNLSYFFGMAQDLMPYVLLVGIVQILKAADRREAELHPFIYAIALLLFSCYVIGTTTNWFIVPIPFLLALSLYPALLAAPPTRVDLLNKLKPRVISGRRWLLDRVFELSFSERLMSSMDQMEKKIVSGDLAIEEFLARRAKLENFAAGVREAAHDLSEEMETSELALSLGPYETNWLNGWHAVKRGLLISLPFLVFYLMTFVLKQIRLDSPFVFLWTSLRIFTFVLDWAAYAFFFGYFFNQLQGESGLKKGLKVALVVIACLSPVWLISGVSAVELSATFLRAGQIFLFFTVLGVWAFDYHTFRSTLREQFSWKKFAQFGDMPSFTAVASVLLTSAGVAFSSVLKGRFLELVTHLVSGIFPEIPGASR
ncbi:MAG TPA: DUF6185 family protein, partial [Pyrinomonadaceae bacterium]|nr:DUF6185 family protein [Pyrinomonadaceae bacterium]